MLADWIDWNTTAEEDLRRKSASRKRAQKGRASRSTSRDTFGVSPSSDTPPLRGEGVSGGSAARSTGRAAAPPGSEVGCLTPDEVDRVSIRMRNLGLEPSVSRIESLSGPSVLRALTYAENGDADAKAWLEREAAA